MSDCLLRVVWQELMEQFNCSALDLLVDEVAPDWRTVAQLLPSRCSKTRLQKRFFYESTLRNIEKSSGGNRNGAIECCRDVLYRWTSECDRHDLHLLLETLDLAGHGKLAAKLLRILLREHGLATGNSRGCALCAEHLSLEDSEYSKLTTAVEEMDSQLFPIEESSPPENATGCGMPVNVPVVASLECPEGHRNLISCIDCRAVVDKKTFLRHKMTSCSQKLAQCMYCLLSVPWAELQVHQDAHCPDRPVDCPNGCTTPGLLRRQLPEHRKVCPLEVVHCFYSYNGCQFEGTRENVKVHLDGNEVYHRVLVARTHEAAGQKAVCNTTASHAAEFTGTPSSPAEAVDLQTVTTSSSSTAVATEESVTPSRSSILQETPLPDISLRLDVLEVQSVGGIIVWKIASTDTTPPSELPATDAHSTVLRINSNTVTLSMPIDLRNAVPEMPNGCETFKPDPGSSFFSQSVLGSGRILASGKRHGPAENTGGAVGDICAATEQ